MRRTIYPLVLFLGLLIQGGRCEPYLQIRLTVDGVERRAVASIPAQAQGQANPLVFAFHGHGGTMMAAALNYECEAYWPEAIVVYPQGLKTPGGIVDAEGRYPGWQMNPGDQGDRDLRFFDALLDYLRSRYPVDPKRVFVLGHSNGGLFSYELWAARPEAVAGIGAIAAILAPKTDRKALVPKPVFHVAGRNDPLVLYPWQLDTVDAVRRANRCEDPPVELPGGVLEYPSSLGAPFRAYIHEGGHEVPEGAIASIVEFFRSLP